MPLFGNDQTQGVGEINKVKAIYTNQEGTDALRSFINTTLLSGAPESHMKRISKYQLNWHFYNGEHWRDNNEMFLSFNYCRVIPDKINSFLLGPKGMSLTVINETGEQVDENIEKAAEAFINSVWRYNGGVRKQKEILQTGGVCGDVWILLQLQAKNYSKKQNDNYIQIECLDSRHCGPEFKDGDYNNMDGFVIRMPLGPNKDNYLLKVTKFTATTIETWYQTDTVYDYTKTTRFLPTSDTNPYGFIPVVHIQNRVNAGDFYGYSDLDDILKLNKIYNELAQTVKEIIDYYAMPVTVVTGGTIKSMTRGVGRVWSGLPSEANVFNLSLGEDLTSSMTFMELIKNGLHELSDVPASTMGKLQQISNTSAAALQITYQPLIQQADAKSVTYTEGFKKLHMMIVKMTRIVDSENILFKQLMDAFYNPQKPKDADSNTPAPVKPKTDDLFEEFFNVSPEWVYGLPQDRNVDLQQAQMELGMKINSRRGIMNRLGFKNVPELQKEIDKEYLHDVANQATAEGMIMTVQNRVNAASGGVGGAGGSSANQAQKSAPDLSGNYAGQ